MRFERHSKSMESLREHLENMSTVVEHQRKKNGNGDTHPLSKRTGEKRTLRECVAVMIWEDEDGTETVSVVSDPGITDLEVKGVLHDAVYAVAHVGEEGFNTVAIQ
ncbi:MAG TPA: hypothetical protein VNP73_07725 [Actinomycetota bacterium]|nr:hypothetical protein [Actinomycetota bacterium]